jgi:hypothetical protein
MSYYIFVSDKGKDYHFSDRFELETPYFDFGKGQPVINSSQIYTQKDIDLYCENVPKRLANKIKRLGKGHSTLIDNVLPGGNNIYLKRLTPWQYRKIVKMTKVKQKCQNIREQISVMTEGLQSKLSDSEKLLEEQYIVFIDEILPVG